MKQNWTDFEEQKNSCFVKGRAPWRKVISIKRAIPLLHGHTARTPQKLDLLLHKPKVCQTLKICQTLFQMDYTCYFIYSPQSPVRLVQPVFLIFQVRKQMEEAQMVSCNNPEYWTLITHLCMCGRCCSLRQMAWNPKPDILPLKRGTYHTCQNTICSHPWLMYPVPMLTHFCILQLTMQHSGTLRNSISSASGSIID